MANIDNSLYRQLLDFYGLDAATKLVRDHDFLELTDVHGLLAINAILGDLYTLHNGEIGVRKRRMEIEEALLSRLEEDRKAVTKK